MIPAHDCYNYWPEACPAGSHLTLEQARDATPCTAVRIQPMSRERADLRAHVFMTVNGREQEAFAYYSDELHFTAAEFIGKTLEQARELFHERDIRYLQS